LRCEIGEFCGLWYADGILGNRYNRTDLFALVPQLGLRFESPLEQLDRLHDDDALFRRVREDIARRYPGASSRGRPSTPVAVLLRMLVIKRLYSWSYEQAESFVDDSLVPRPSCRVYLEEVPDDTVLIRWANTMRPFREPHSPQPRGSQFLPTHGQFKCVAVRRRHEDTGRMGLIEFGTNPRHAT
jgi:hypothetical protein